MVASPRNRPALDTDYELGSGCQIDTAVTLGYSSGVSSEPAVIGDDAVIRQGSIIYADVKIGDSFRTGHDVLIRSGSVLGDDVLVGTRTLLDGAVEIGSHVRLQSGVYLPDATVLGDRVFVGPNAVFTNDRYPLRSQNGLEGVSVADHVSVGANATIMPGVSLGENCFVAGGAVVTRDVPPETLAVGVPAEHHPLPDVLNGGNDLP